MSDELLVSYSIFGHLPCRHETPLTKRKFDTTMEESFTLVHMEDLPLNEIEQNIVVEKIHLSCPSL